MHISFFICKLSELYFKFCANSYCFCWKRGEFALWRLSRRTPDFLKKSYLDLIHVISSLNFGRLSRNPHCLAVSGSFRGLSFHAGPKLGITNSKKFEKLQDLCVA
jgi:hypothetical protein